MDAGAAAYGQDQDGKETVIAEDPRADPKDQGLKKVVLY
jgi:hypothetical protein